MSKLNSGNLRLDKNRRLIGNYPKILDLREHEYEIEIVSHSDEEFKKAEKEGKLVQANICVSENGNVETIYFPYDMIGIDYAIIENLPNLTELIVCCKEVSSEELWRVSEELQWLICMNLPKLKKITISGGVKWLQIENAAALESINVGKCKTLDYFSIKKTPSLKSINIKNCRKLKNIIGMNVAKQDRLGVTSQIQAIQNKSKNKGSVYKDMTYTDVDAVLKIINVGVKLATIKGYFGENADIDLCYGRENDPNFKPFSFKLLRPLEEVYAGGTGELYAYAYLAHDFFNGKYGICSQIGNKNQENCLDYALNSIEVPDCKRPSSKQVLKFLNMLVKIKGS